MLEPFTSNYFLGKFRVYPSDGKQAMLHSIDYAVLCDFYTGSGHPVMKLSSSRHFSVHSDDDVPLWSLAVPQRILEEAGISRTPANTGVLVVKHGWIADMFNM